MASIGQGLMLPGRRGAASHPRSTTVRSISPEENMAALPTSPISDIPTMYGSCPLQPFPQMARDSLSFHHEPVVPIGRVDLHQLGVRQVLCNEPLLFQRT